MFIYVLKVHKGDKIKIGKSKDIVARIKQLPYRFDLAKSFYYEVGDRSLRVEKALHTLLEDYSADMEEGDGYTEFYDESALLVAENIMRSIHIGKLRFEDEVRKSEMNRPIIDISLVKLSSDMKALRKSLGMTQEELAKSAGISRVTLGKFERGTNDHISLGTVVKIQEALGLLNG